MDVSFSNVLEGTRQYFLGLPKQAGGSEAGWAPPDEPAPAQSGAPTPSAPAPTAAAAPRPPSEPLEPEPHIIHKATVMREAAEKRREQHDPDDDEVVAALSPLSPPPHIIRRPGPDPPVAASPRPPSQTPTPGTPAPAEPPVAPTPHSHSGTPVARPPEHFTPARPPDPYSSSRPPEPYQRYYESHSTATDAGRPPGPLPSPQPPPRHGSPQTYARLSSTLPAHASRLREGAAHSPPAQRYALPAGPQPPHNDRVPPIHHPAPGPAAPSAQRVPLPESRSAHYAPLPVRREPSPYARAPHYERHPPLPQRKYDPQQAYPGYRPAASQPPPAPPHRIEPHHATQYQHAPATTHTAHYPPKPLERVPAPQHAYQHETIRRTEYPNISRPIADTRSGYHYPTASTSSSRYASAASAAPSAAPAPARPVPRPAAAPKSNYEYATANHIQTSPARSVVKPGYPNQQARMTVSVTTLVNQMNQTKQKRESPLDLSVKTVKNSADSSTTQDDVVDSASSENKVLPLHQRPTSSSRHGSTSQGFSESHKVDFAPNFSQYRERTSSQSSYPPPAAAIPAGHHPVRYNGSYETRRPLAEPYPVESRQHVYPDRSKYSVPAARPEYVPRIDLTRPASDDQRRDNRIRDDRHFIIEERKRPAATIVSNIPEKIVRYETWSADSRIDRMTQSAREQRELMSQPVYSYSSHKQYEAYQNEQKRLASTSIYRDQHHHHNHINQRHAYPPEAPPRERHDYHAHHHERAPPNPIRQVIQKIPSHRDIHPHHVDPHSGIPADKRVLSILRNSLETKQTGFVEPPKQAKHIPDLIVIDDEHDSVIEITDLTKDSDIDTASKSAFASKPSHPHGPAATHHIQMPRAVDSFENTDSKSPPENDVASRIRTKAEMKALPPSDSSGRHEFKQDEPARILPKSQKQHLFNQIREDQILESVIKSENIPEGRITEIKSEPMNIDEIEKDAVMPLKLENVSESLPPESVGPTCLDTPGPEDLDWASACDSFMEQLKTGVHKKKTRKSRIDTLDRDPENKTVKIPKVEPVDDLSEKIDQIENEKPIFMAEKPVIIKQEPVDEEDTVEPLAAVECKINTEKSADNLEISKNDCVEKEDNKETIVLKEKEKDKQKVDQDLKKKNVEESPAKVKRSLDANLDTDKSKIKKSLPEEKSKVGRPKKSLTLREEKDKMGKKSQQDKDKTPQKDKDKTPQKDKDKTPQKDKDKMKKTADLPQIEKDKIKKTTDTRQDEKDKLRSTTDFKEDKDFVRGKPRKSITLEPSDVEKEKRKRNNSKQNVVDEKDTEIEKQKTSKTRQSVNNEQEAEKEKRRTSKTRHCEQIESDVEKDKRKTIKTKPGVEKQYTEKEKMPEKTNKSLPRSDKNRVLRKTPKIDDKSPKEKCNSKKSENAESSPIKIKKEKTEDDQSMIAKVKDEPESTDDDEPLIKSKMQKEKEIRYQMLKDLSEKSAYVKLECFEVDLNKNKRISIDSLTWDKEKTDDKEAKGKITKQAPKLKEKVRPKILNDDDTTSCSDDEDLIVATRLRARKSIKTEEKDNKTPTIHKTPVKTSIKKQENNAIITSTPLRKPGFGDGSDFRPGWEEELYRYKRSLRMPTRLIAIPRGRSGGPFIRGSGSHYNRGSTSLPDLDPAPLSPAPSSAPSAVTDADLYARRQDKLANIDSDLDSNSSYSANNRLQYDSEASTSTVFSSITRKKGSSIVDVLIQKCGKHDPKKKNKDKDDKTPKIIPKSANPNELLPTPSLGLLKNGNKGSLSAKKEKLMEDIFYLGAFRKETVNAYRNAFIKNTDGLIGATEEFSPVVLKSRTRTESKVLKQRATIKEVFGDERPASAPPSSCREEKEPQDVDSEEQENEPLAEIKKEKDTEAKPKLKPKKINKDKLLRRSNSIRDGLRSTKSLKRNDAKGRLMRLKHRNSLMKTLASKRMKDLSGNKIKKEIPENQTDLDKSKEEDGSPSTVDEPKRRFKRLFGRRKFSSGFDYIRKKKKIIRREETPNNKIRRPAVKPSPESVHDIQKEIKGWFINKSVGETHLHRAARLGYTDCVAYCLEKMEVEPSAKDNAGFTPLHVAAARGHVRIARLLLQYGANVSAAANGGIRPLHEACENGHVEMIRLLLAYGADPLLGTYAGQTPEELTEGPAALLLRLHIADVQGLAIEPWRFPPPAEIIDCEEVGCDPLSSPPPASPPPPPDAMVELQCTEFPLPPFYSLRTVPGQPADGLWCLLQDITSILQIKSKDSLLKQIHCGSGSPKELFRELRTQEFLERAQCHQLLCAGEKVNIRASKVALVRVTDKLRQLLKIETVLVS